MNSDDVGAITWLIIIFGVMVAFVMATEGCSEKLAKEKIIKDSGFCVETETTGLKFSKCYELSEKK